VLDALRSGEDRYRAARCAGVHRSTFYRWLESDAQFRRDVERVKTARQRESLALLPAASVKPLVEQPCGAPRRAYRFVLSAHC
jgi:hypothetical protein